MAGIIITEPIGSTIVYGVSKNGTVEGIEEVSYVPVIDSYAGQELENGVTYYVFTMDTSQETSFQPGSVRKFLYKDGSWQPVSWNDTLKVNPNATTVAPNMQVGATIVGKGTDKDGRPIRLLLDLEDAPEDGDFYLPLIEDRSKATYKVPLSRGAELLLGDETPTTPTDPGDPVAPTYNNIVISSGETLNQPLSPFKKADGSVYPLALDYVAQNLIDGFSFDFDSSSIRLYGNRVTATEITRTITIIGKTRVSPIRQASSSFTLTVLAAVVAPETQNPVVAPIGNQNATQGEGFSYQVSATHNRVLTYSAIGLPVGLTINVNTGKITGTPANSGSAQIIVTATDDLNKSGSASFLLTIAPAPVTDWLTATGIKTDVNTKTVSLFFATVGISTMQVSVERLDGGINTGKNSIGGQWTTDPTGGTFWQTCIVESNGGGAFNFAAYYWPQSFQPITDGPALNKGYKVRMRRNSGDTAIVRYFFFNPAANIDPVLPLLTAEPPTGGTTSNHIPVAPVVSAQTAYVGQYFRYEIPLFTDPDEGDVLTVTAGGFVNTIFTFTKLSDKYVFEGTPQYQAQFQLIITATDTNGGQNFVNIPITVQPAQPAISKVNGRFFVGSMDSSSNITNVNPDGAWICYQILLKGTNLPTGAVPQVGVAVYGAGGGSADTIYWFAMVNRTTDEFTHVEGHQTGPVYAGSYNDYYVRVLNSAGSVIVQPIKVYTRDIGVRADTGTLSLYPSTTTATSQIIETWEY